MQQQLITMPIDDVTTKMSATLIGSIFFISYITFGLIIVFPSEVFTLEQFQMVCGTIWMSFILSISFMEAWGKFQAPFVPKVLALSIGQLVFTLLNSIEAAICVVIWISLISANIMNPELDTIANARLANVCLITLTSILVTQLCVLTPILSLQVDFSLLQELQGSIQKGTTMADWMQKELEKLGENIKRKTNNRGKDSLPSKVHLVYVLSEFAKIFLLAAYVLQWANKM